MLSASMAPAPRSTLEEMLEALTKREEKPKDLPPALPSRPTSKARLPSNVRMRISPSLSVGRSSQLPAHSGRETGAVVESARVSGEPVGLKSGDARVSVQGPKPRTKGEIIENNGAGNVFPREGEVGEKKMSENISNGAEEVNGFLNGGADSGTQDSDLSDLHYYSTLDSPYGRSIGSGYESNCRDCRSSTSVAKLEHVEGKGANVHGLTKNSRVWCMVLDNQWTSGMIQSIIGKESVIKTSDGYVVKVPVSNLLPAYPYILEGVDDLVQLSFLNEPSIIHNLEHRYTQDMIYTKAGGSVLVAINPFKDLSLFGDEIIQAYRCKARSIPHVYMMTDMAFDAMMKDGTDQSIIVSGESGAGKTETAKIAMRYLASLGGNSKIENKILQTNTILESFGNAKTQRNNNSSRFGKLIGIHFNASGKICGATTETYLLEKSRVVRRAQGERSYHIFYQLCAGASPDMRDRLNLKPADGYCYLNHSNSPTIDKVNDAERFKLLLKALNVVQISHEDQETAFQILAAVLWLGNVTFSIVDTECHVRVDNNEAVRNASKLLGCSVVDLMAVLSTCKVYAGNKYVVQKLSQAQAVDRRDTLAKAIYANLFDWLVDCINKSLTAHESHKIRSINIIDFYGFESVNRNSFEQLCINYANERIQQQFNRHLFKRVQEDYSLEGIDWIKFEFEDNQECLDLIEKKPVGLFSLLDEVSASPEGTDSTLSNRFKQQLSGKSCFKGERGRVFSVQHCAGEVVYDATGFLEQNRDPVHSDLLELLSSSNCELLKLFALNVTKESQRFIGPRSTVNGSAGNKLSVATKFKGQLFKLLQLVENTSQHFICCIKPNRIQLPGVFEQEVVLQQLRCSGVFDVVRMSRIGYPTRMTHEQFAKRYEFLLSQDIGATNALRTCVAILHHLKVSPWMYQVGLTKLFLRAGQNVWLEELRTRTLRGILSVQNAFRTYVARSQFKKLRNATILLQTLVRSSRARKEYVVLKERHQAAVTIQKELRCRIARKKYTRALKMVILVQSVTRGWLARRHTDMIHHQLQIENSDGRMIAEKSIGHLNAGRRNEIFPEHKQVQSAKCWSMPMHNLQGGEHKQSSEDAIQHASTFKVQPLFPADIQNHLLVADAALKEKEDENAVLRQRLQQYETRWQEYQARMTSMEEMWQEQISSLQTSLAAAKKNRTRDELTIQQTRYDELTNLRPSGQRASVPRQTLPHDNGEFDWEDAASMETKIPKSNLTSGKVSRHSDGGQSREHESVVSHVMKEFEHRTHVFNDDANFLVEVKSGQAEANLNPDEELRKLKKRFKAWKKAFKVKLRETKTMLHKLGNMETSEKMKRKWWGKRSN